MYKETRIEFWRDHKEDVIVPESSEKKKSAAKKVKGVKKSSQTKRTSKIDVKQIAKPRKKTTAKKKAPAKAAAKTKPAKPAPRGKAVVSIKALLFKQYDTGTMHKLVGESPYRKQAPVEIPESPPFVASGDQEETARIRALLFREFNLESQLIPVGIADAGPLKETLEVSTPPPVLSKQEDSGGYALKLGLFGLAVLMTIVIAASLSNRRSFFLKDVGGTVEVWQGKFAPRGSELILSVKDMKMPNPLREIYSKAEVYQLVFNHFQDRADTLLYNPAGPDFSQINECLREAASYAPTQAERVKAQRRLDSIAFLVLLHKVDVALIKGGLSDLEGARVILEQGTKYATHDYERDLIARRKAVLETAISRLSGR